jgi:hypothetical protein
VGALFGGAGTTWSVRDVLAVLCNPTDRWVIDRIQADGVHIVAFSDAIDRWRDNVSGVETDVSIASGLKGNTDRGSRTIRLNERLSSDEAAMALFHEMGHWVRPNATTREAGLKQEIDTRVDTEEFMIRHGMPATKPEYRTPDGHVDRAKIDADVRASDHYNPTTRTRVKRSYTGEREITGWKCP